MLLGCTLLLGGRAVAQQPFTSLRVSAPRTVVHVGETVPLTVTGVRMDGSTADLTGASTGTAYFPSGMDVTVSPDGLVTVVDGADLRSTATSDALVIAVTNGALGAAILLELASLDADGDRMDDGFERRHVLDPSNPADAVGDPDGDALSNREEFAMGTDPRSPDTDGDGALDGEEARRGSDPINPAQQFRLDENCIVSVLNRETRVEPGGAFVLANVPTGGGTLVRARVVCEQDGMTIRGQSPLTPLVRNGSTDFADVQLGVEIPIPVALQLSATKTVLTMPGEQSQLGATCILPRGGTNDCTAAGGGTAYDASNPAICTVNAEGLVQAAGSGTCIVTAANDGVLGSLRLSVQLGSGRDGDEMPDDYEALRPCLDSDTADGQGDPDGDGLTSSAEFSFGSEPCIADTDSDGLNDGAEQAPGTNPTAADSDLDGLLDGDEVARGTDPLGEHSDAGCLPDGSEARLELDPLNPADDGGDADADGISNCDEVEIFTDPGDRDSDGDGLSDGAEVAAGDDPLVAEIEPPAVLIANPAEGATLLEGETISIGATANDNAAVRAVEFFVDTASFAVDETPPYELTFTVPFAVSRLEFRATATDVAGNLGTAPTVSASVIPDPSTTVQGSVADPFGNPLAAADVTVELQGLDAEFFDFDAPLSSLPDLTGLGADVRGLVSAVNFRNPSNLFNTDTFDVGLGPDFAARFTGFIRIPVPGVRSFILGTDDGARLLINGTTVVEVTGSGGFSEASASIELPAGDSPLEIRYYQRTGAAELQLSHIPPGGAREVVPPTLLIPSSTVTGVSGPGGVFSFFEVPAALGSIRVSAEATVQGELQSGSSASILPVNGGTTDVGVVVVGQNVFPRNDGTLATFELNGDTRDSSGNGRHAVLLGGEFVSSVWGMGLHVFPGGPTGIDWSAFAALLVHPYTVEFVLTPQEISSFRKLFSFDDTIDRGWYYLNRGIQAYPFELVGAGQLNPGERHYIAFVSTASNRVDVYLQGMLVGSADASFTAPGPQAIFFRDDSATARREQIDAIVEALRISRVARTAEEITAIQQRLAERVAGIDIAPPSASREAVDPTAPSP